MSTPKSPSNILIPIKLDAFVLNPRVCEGVTPQAKIAPISRPDYVGLRLSNKTIKSDLFSTVDLRYCTPSAKNRRMTDIGNGKTRWNRCGVYLSWILPSVYRTGSMASESATERQEDHLRKGAYPPTAHKAKADYTSPVFRPVPVRWLVVRHMPKRDLSEVPEFEGWIVESDRKTELTDLVASDADVDVDASPYVDPGGSGNSSIDIDKQAGVFIGRKTKVTEWNEEGDAVSRVPLSALNSGNEYFADFQPHNSNVFSLLDTFEYEDSNGKLKCLSKLTANYYVVGWHSDSDHDLFDISADTNTTLGERLKNLRMKLRNEGSQTIKDCLASSEGRRLLCHGAIYNVRYDIDRQPDTIPADKSGAYLNAKMPISFGTTELDSLLAYMKAHENNDRDLKARNAERDITAIQALLLAEDTGPDGWMEAEDEINNHNFSRTSGGGIFHLAGEVGSAEKTSALTSVQIEQLRRLNLVQEDLNLCHRLEPQLRREMFSLWWRNTSHPEEGSFKEKVSKSTSRLKILIKTIKSLRAQIASSSAKLATSTGKQPTLGALPEFYKPRDPTISIGGISSAWPHDFLDPLEVRLDSQIVLCLPAARTFFDSIKTKLPSEFQSTISNLLSEFVHLASKSTYEESNSSWEIPLYHDTDLNPATKDLKRDCWNNRQPWFPLFVEWEVEYWHIPFENWVIEERYDARGRKVTGYGIKPGIDLAEPEDDVNNDRRTLSGRIPILPQIGINLATKIEQLFASTPTSVLDPILSSEERAKLLDNVKTLQFLGFQMTGFIDHMLTRSHGVHFSPNLRRPGQTLEPISSALATSQGFDLEQLELMSDQTHTTPYGGLIDLSDHKFSAFKPCTHGQLRFTKFDIIDKFGQGIHAIEPDLESWRKRPKIYPCVSNFYACETLDNDPKKPNAVLRSTTSDGSCEFVQLPPQINQYARLNSHFVVQDGSSSDSNNTTWRPSNEWDNPVWGWVLVNIVNDSLQLFLHDGIFYREVRLGGPSGSDVEPKWLPFQPPASPPDSSQQQMDHLVSKLSKKDYLEAFILMIKDALNHTLHTPATYSQSLNSLIGRPLALVNTGWSIELAAPPHTNQSDLNNYKPGMTLTGEDGTDQYAFPVKLGDWQRAYDGLIGYFNVPSTAPSNDGSTLDPHTIYTYFCPSSSSTSSPTTLIGTDNYPLLHPFYTSPLTPSNPAVAVSPTNLALQRNKHLLVLSMLIEPFSAVHAYTGILPSRALKLPGWTWQKALQAMATFVYTGPLLMTNDVPTFDKRYVAKGGAAGKGADDEVVPVKSSVRVPVPGSGREWVWLQPYVVEKDGKDGGKKDEGKKKEEKKEEEEVETAFMTLEVGREDGAVGLEPGPYTVLEGYLQLKK